MISTLLRIAVPPLLALACTLPARAGAGCIDENNIELRECSGPAAPAGPTASPREQLQGRYLDAVTREGYRISHDISAYSFAALGKAARPLMQGRAASMLTLTYLGAVRSVPMYNVMGPAKASLEANVRYMAAELGREGIRVNGISAGPIKTLAAAGIKGFRSMLSNAEKVSPLRRNVTIEDVGNTAAFLSSHLASGITGQIIYVDAGFNIVGFAIDEGGA